MTYQIPFHQLFLTGKESDYMRDALRSGKISGNGSYTKSCASFLETHYQYKKVFLTSSCTDALEMMAVLLDIRPGDRIIAPSFTFVSTVNPFVMRGAEIDFVDSLPHHPNLDVQQVEALITPKTRAIIAVHYAGMSVELDALLAICQKHHIHLLEDAAQGIGAVYRQKYLGGFGTFGALSFHDTKNVTGGEGGALIVNDASFVARAEVIWEKGTNRNAFIRGEVSKYEWVDVGSSYLCSELTSACLLAQLEEERIIRYRRQQLWNRYHERLHAHAGHPVVADAGHNAHIYFLRLENEEVREALKNKLQNHGIQAVSHYTALHESAYFTKSHEALCLTHASAHAAGLLRLPLYPGLSEADQDRIMDIVTDFFRSRLTKSD